MEPKDTLEFLEKVSERLGLVGGIIVIILLILFWVLSTHLKQSIKSAAEESYLKTLEELKSQLSKNLQTQVGLFFRDESVRNNLLTYIGQKSFDKKIECWQATQGMYFEYQRMWSFSKDTNNSEYVDLDDKLNNLRTKIFTETVYLGYELSSKLIRQNSLMRENLRNKRTELIYSGENYQFHNEGVLQKTLSRINQVETNITDLLYETEQLVITKLHSDQTIEKFDFTKEQLEKIKEERHKQFSSMT